jgi:hypothetical protein
MRWAAAALLAAIGCTQAQLASDAAGPDAARPDARASDAPLPDGRPPAEGSADVLRQTCLAMQQVWWEESQRFLPRACTSSWECSASPVARHADLTETCDCVPTIAGAQGPQPAGESYTLERAFAALCVDRPGLDLGQGCAAGIPVAECIDGQCQVTGAHCPGSDAGVPAAPAADAGPPPAPITTDLRRDACLRLQQMWWVAMAGADRSCASAAECMPVGFTTDRFGGPTCDCLPPITGHEPPQAVRIGGYPAAAEWLEWAFRYMCVERPELDLPWWCDEGLPEVECWGTCVVPIGSGCWF